MPYDANGLFTYTVTSVAPDAVSGTTISSADQDTFTADLATALNLCLLRNGNADATDNLPMGGFKHTGAADGSAATDYATYGQLDARALLNVSVIDIGPWDMDANSSKNVTHGLTLTKIRSLSAVLRSDAGTTQYNITPGPFPGGTDVQSNIAALTATEVQLKRLTGGIFDGVGYDNITADYNRGWITIHYTD